MPYRTKLGAKHLQLEMYAVNEGAEWMILANEQVQTLAKQTWR
jgi:hypothetical protein